VKRVIVIGGGLAGLVAALGLVKAGVECVVLEKKVYPFHRVCGEYISDETVPFLKQLGVYPERFEPPQISRFMLSSVAGRRAVLPLDPGGFGISRYTFDNFLYEEAARRGVEFVLNTEAESVIFDGDMFTVNAGGKQYTADFVIGAFGKRSKLDHSLQRDFIQRRSPYVGVKYHIRTEHPSDLIALHNFAGGYCGMSNIEDGKTTLCYLVHRDVLREFGSIAEMEQQALCRNPLLNDVFRNADFLFEKPEVINEISFATKTAVEQHVLMAGDSAGMITPLCGNGMAMAIHSARLLTDLLVRFYNGERLSRSAVETLYTQQWRKQFSTRLWLGRHVQRLFGSEAASRLAIGLAVNVPLVAGLMIKYTRGRQPV